jgi:predicted Zn-dependent protease
MKAHLRMAKVIALALLAAVITTTGCKSTALMSRADEIRIGQEASAEVEKQYPLDPNPADQAVVQSLGQRILAANEAGDYPYTFKVLDSKEINAFSLPGGPVYLFKGLLDMTEGDEDELAAVIAHEMGHITARHIAKMYTQGFWLDILISLGTRGQAQDIARLGALITELHFSREDEYEADRIAIRFTHAAGFDPNGLVRFFERLRREEQGGHSDLEKIFRTHPLTDDRVRKAKEEISRLPQDGS